MRKGKNAESTRKLEKDIKSGSAYRAAKQGTLSWDKEKWKFEALFRWIRKGKCEYFSISVKNTAKVGSDLEKVYVNTTKLRGQAFKFSWTAFTGQSALSENATNVKLWKWAEMFWS